MLKVSQLLAFFIRKLTFVTPILTKVGGREAASTFSNQRGYESQCFLSAYHKSKKGGVGDRRPDFSAPERPRYRDIEMRLRGRQGGEGGGGLEIRRYGDTTDTTDTTDTISPGGEGRGGDIEIWVSQRKSMQT